MGGEYRCIADISYGAVWNSPAWSVSRTTNVTWLVSVDVNTPSLDVGLRHPLWSDHIDCLDGGASQPDEWVAEALNGSFSCVAGSFHLGMNLRDATFSIVNRDDVTGFVGMQVGRCVRIE